MLHNLNRWDILLTSSLLKFFVNIIDWLLEIFIRVFLDILHIWCLSTMVSWGYSLALNLTQASTLDLSNLWLSTEWLNKHLGVTILSESRRVLLAMRTLSSDHVRPNFFQQIDLELLNDWGLAWFKHLVGLLWLLIGLDILKLRHYLVLKFFFFYIEPPLHVI